MGEKIGVEKIGHYTIVSELGRGGMGVVYKAHEESLNRLVALKVLGKHLSEDASFVARFKREAQSAAALNHPNIVQVYAISEFDGQHCFAMEFVSGSSIQQIIRADGPMDPVKAARLILQAASGLGAAHGKGIYHRDIKPANLMVDESGILKIADFGLAILAAGTTQLTATGTFMGTPGYLSPEQCLGENVDQRTDIYSLGVTLYEMLTGVTPLKADSPLALLRQIIDVEPRDVGELQPEVPESLRAILRKMMAKKPEDRYPDCAVLITDLQQWLESNGVQVSHSSPLYRPPASAGTSGDAATVIAPALKSAEDTVEISAKNPVISNTKRNSMSALVIALVLMVAAGASYATWKYVFEKPEQSLAANVNSVDADRPGAGLDEPRGYLDVPVDQDARPDADAAPQFADSNYPESVADNPVDQLDLQSSQSEWTGDEWDATTEDAVTATGGQNPIQAVDWVGAEQMSLAATDVRDDADEQGPAPEEHFTGSGALNPAGTLAMADVDATGTGAVASAGPGAAASPEPVLASTNVAAAAAVSKPAVAAPAVGTGVALISIGEVLLADSAADYVRQVLSRRGIAVIDGMTIPGVAERLNSGGGEIRSLIRPVARYLVYIRADFTSERELYYMGRPDIEIQSRLNLETHDLLDGRPMGEGVHASVGYTSLSVETKVQELLRPRFGPVAARLTQ